MLTSECHKWSWSTVKSSKGRVFPEPSLEMSRGASFSREGCWCVRSLLGRGLQLPRSDRRPFSSPSLVGVSVGAMLIYSWINLPPCRSLQDSQDVVVLTTIFPLCIGMGLGVRGGLCEQLPLCQSRASSSCSKSVLMLLIDVIPAFKCWWGCPHRSNVPSHKFIQDYLEVWANLSKNWSVSMPWVKGEQGKKIETNHWSDFSPYNFKK